jgi:hypothetical protein
MASFALAGLRVRQQGWLLPPLACLHGMASFALGGLRVRQQGWLPPGHGTPLRVESDPTFLDFRAYVFTTAGAETEPACRLGGVDLLHPAGGARCLMRFP